MYDILIKVFFTILPKFLFEISLVNVGNNAKYYLKFILSKFLQNNSFLNFKHETKIIIHFLGYLI